MSRHVLEVFIYGRFAGVATRDGGRIMFTYDSDYAADDQSTPLSISMPLTALTHPKRVVEAFMRGLLPDNSEVRRRWARAHDLRDRDTFGLIAAIGEDVAGAVTFRALPAELPGVRDSLIVQGESSIAARLRALRADDANWRASADDEHWSLAGAQGKFALTQTDSGWALPSGDIASTHIFKPGITRIRDQALIEHLTMNAMAKAGLPVAETQIAQFEDQLAIVVRRFDRSSKADGVPLRVHQEDLVQALGLDPSRKYQTDGGPAAADIVGLLRAVADLPSVDRFIDAVIANYLIGAPDAHAKNYSVLLAGPTAILAPLYDVATGLVPDAAGRMPWDKAAMSIGGEARFGEVSAKNWGKFAFAVGRPEDYVRDRVQELASILPDAFAESVREVTDSVAEAAISGAELTKIPSRIAKLGQRTLQDLAAGSSGRPHRAGRFVDELG